MFSLVIPVYKNEGSLPALLDALDAVRSKLSQPLEVVFVVDGSPDHCFEKLRVELPKRSFRSQLIGHSRNFGSFAAIRTGLAAAKGEHFAVMAADLQEPPSLIEKTKVFKARNRGLSREARWLGSGVLGVNKSGPSCARRNFR